MAYFDFDFSCLLHGPASDRLPCAICPTRRKPLLTWSSACCLGGFCVSYEAMHVQVTT